jgi:hypothetical protein
MVCEGLKEICVRQPINSPFKPLPNIPLIYQRNERINMETGGDGFARGCKQSGDRGKQCYN